MLFKTKKIILFFFIAAVVSGCAVTRGGFYHKIQDGDTLSFISKKYDVDIDILKRINYIKNGSTIIKGKLLYIPYPKDRYAAIIKKQAKQQKSIEVAQSGVTDATAKKTVKPPKKTYSENSSKKTAKISQNKKNKSSDFFSWPAIGEIVSYYSPLTRGINIKTVKDAEIKSIESGTVIFAGLLEGYGNTVIIRHNETYLSVYSYLSEIKVTQNSELEKNHTIGISGENEFNIKYGSPVLHFEIRKNIDNNPVSVNPLDYLEK